MEIEVLPPDINAGRSSSRSPSEGKIHFGLAAIKGVGQKAVEAIVAAREAGGPFASLDDFFERVPLATVGQACVETLIKAGRLRRPRGPPEPAAGRPAPRRRRPARRARRTASAARGASSTPSTSNGSAEPAAARQSLPDIPELPDAERLAEEKKVLGFYMSSHPLTRHAALLQALATHQVAELGGVPEKVGGDPRRDDRRRPGQERPEEPVGPDPDGQAHLRGPDRAPSRRCSGPRSSPSTRTSSRTT